MELHRRSDTISPEREERGRWRVFSGRCCSDAGTTPGAPPFSIVLGSWWNWDLTCRETHHRTAAAAAVVVVVFSSFRLQLRWKSWTFSNVCIDAVHGLHWNDTTASAALHQVQIGPGVVILLSMFKTLATLLKTLWILFYSATCGDTAQFLLLRHSLCQHKPL